MSNIWGFFAQTIEVSIIACVILLLKRIFKDKLSPKWQYGIWIILLLRLVIPVGMHGSYIVPHFQILLEGVKSLIESHLSSSYTLPYVFSQTKSFIPYIKAVPVSITDYLFVVYIIGVIFYVLRYISEYIKLKKILRYGKSVDENTLSYLKEIGCKYKLKLCDCIIVEGVPSAFVFGVFHKTLIIPDDKQDYKVFIHELLHVKYQDVLQNMIWSILLAIHWCNPFMHYVIKTIHNDMESLCDYRVLELLDGEERREYGKILLGMVNEKYSGVFGTSSLSNGAHFIKERIETIVRFKRYPIGMKSVSICIIIVLLPLLFNNNVSAVYIDQGLEQDTDKLSYHISYASARLSKATTLAGAIDTYAKGILTSNNLYLTSVMPDAYAKDNREAYFNNSPSIQYYDVISSENGEHLYEVYNLKQLDKDRYRAVLFFASHKQTDDKYVAKCTSVPIEVIKEDGWKVKQIEEETYKEIVRDFSYISELELINNESLYTFNYENEYGVLELEYINRYYINSNNCNHNGEFKINGRYVCTTPDTNAHFCQEDLIFEGEYKYNYNHIPYDKVGYAFVVLEYIDQPVNFDFVDLDSSGGTSSNGMKYYFDYVSWLEQENKSLSVDLWIHESGANIDYIMGDAIAQIQVYHDRNAVTNLKIDASRGEIYASN